MKAGVTMRWAQFSLLVVGGALSILATAREPEALEWLEKAAKAARERPYAGVFVQQTWETSSSVRITHMVDRQGVEVEKIEGLDGPAFEIVRRNEEMVCYHPDVKTVRLDRRSTGRFFPSLISGQPQAIAANYRLRLGNVERVAGFDCRWIILEPRDALRYLQKWCAEVSSGLLLRARTYGERGQLLEQFMFTQLEMGRGILKHSVKSQYEDKVGWQQEVAVKPTQRDTDTGWLVSGLPSGFRKAGEMIRRLSGRPEPVAHLVYSDGVAHVSVFAEPTEVPGSIAAAGASDESPTTFAVRTVGDYQVTVMGELPLAAVQAIADGVTRRAK